MKRSSLGIAGACLGVQLLVVYGLLSVLYVCSPKPSALGALLWGGAIVAVLTGLIFYIFMRLMERERHSREVRYRRVVEFLPEPVVVHQAFRMLYANAAAAAIVGEDSAAALKGRMIYDYIHPGDVQRMLDRILRLKESGLPTEIDETRLVSKNGGTVYVEVTSTMIDYDGTEAVLTSVRDVTEQRLAEQRIDEHRRLIDRVLEAQLDGILLCDQDGVILFANERFLSFFHCGDLTGRTLAESYRSLEWGLEADPYFLERMTAYARGHAPGFQEKYELHRPEATLHIEVHGIPITNVTRQGNRRETLFVFRDRSSEERVNVLKNELISTVSHEMRTPLASIQGFVEILLTRELTPEKTNHYLGTVHREALRLGRLIEDFLDIQHMEQGKLAYRKERIDAAVLLKEVARQWRGKQKHAVQLSVEGDRCFVLADSGRLRQAVNQLISNAIKYSPDADRVDIRLAAAGDTVALSVRDYGLGIPDAAKPQLFSKFYRIDNSDSRQSGGAGLGLAIVKSIVEAHNGTIVLDSEPGKGSTFTIRLPRHSRLDDAAEFAV
ncbi:ATP-binding protein [Paenibacillus chartarius]|uniref:histidine kinase n=1 Tax=Paenibacillus chartarius TaxID=747481 RepID=A0ABV6DG61_9BACL